MHELGHTLCQWLKARTLMIRFHGLVALVLTLALLTGSLPASAASADPLPETNDAVRDAAVEEVPTCMNGVTISPLSPTSTQ